MSRPSELQIDDMSNGLRNSLWNILLQLYDPRDHDEGYWLKVTKHIATYFAKIPADELPYGDRECRKWLKNLFYKLEWYDIYDLIEFIASEHETTTYRLPLHQSLGIKHRVSRQQLLSVLNNILERELSGHRFISGIITPITTPTETRDVEYALDSTASKGLDGAHQHLEAALRLLGQKPEPDYRNSIKESVSSIESIAKVISGQDGGGLKDALASVAKSRNIHKSLISGFLSLYGYTSDEDSTRHAILEPCDIGFAEAKYMLVSCSAFVNYMIARNDEKR